MDFKPGVWGATGQKVHLIPAPARKPLCRLVSSGKPSYCRTEPITAFRTSRDADTGAENSFDETKF
ncbi:hypothetical protein EAH72_34715 [Pseudomonas caspiana]|nr:hypothetical protein EAH72_34715 [Pseudomonas caspiana]